MFSEGWSGRAMVMDNLPCRAVLQIWIKMGQGPTVLAVGAGRGCFDIFSPSPSPHLSVKWPDID